MDQFELGRRYGRLEAIVEDHSNRLRDLEQRETESHRPRSRDRDPSPLATLMPYLMYGVSLLGLAIAGKITWLQMADKLMP